ncbi:MAG: mannose-6-phosphate isomerase-like protein (cupin superfamily) [Gammaproteobacteria bacterium]
MFVKKTSDCEAFVANDGCNIRELLHPKNDVVDLPYSLALATVEIGKQSYQHKLEQTEVYHILQGHGQMIVDSEVCEVVAGDVIVIPEQALQWIENIGNEPLVFVAIVSPPWTEDGDVRIEQTNDSA